MGYLADVPLSVSGVEGVQMKDALRRSIGITLLACSTVGLLAQAAAPANGGTAYAKATSAKKAAAVDGNPPERAFQTHCSRCHYAPETLSPRITGTVVRHMRVRANLSAEDERLILSYLNP
jgi:cytochrome c5